MPVRHVALPKEAHISCLVIARASTLSLNLNSTQACGGMPSLN